MLAFLVLAGAGCGSKSGGQGGTFEGIDWVLLSYDTGSGMRGVPLGVNVDARFESGRVSGSSGVNTYSAAYRSSGSSLTISQAVSTMMAGPPEAMQVEQDYLAALSRSSTYTASGDTLTIYDSDGKEILSYNRGTGAGPHRGHLEGHRLQQRQGSGGRASSPAPPSPPSSGRTAPSPGTAASTTTRRPISPKAVPSPSPRRSPR